MRLIISNLVASESNVRNECDTRTGICCVPLERPFGDIGVRPKFLCKCSLELINRNLSKSISILLDILIHDY